MGIRLSNNAQTTLSSAISATDTSITVADGSVFPALSGSDYTYVTLEDTSGNLEIVKVTAISSNTLTVTRGQDSTTARAFASGDFVQLRVTAALLNDLSDEASVTLWADIQNKPDSVITLAGDASGSATMTDLGSATLTVTIADDSHNHVISNVDGLQTALNAKQDASTALTTSTTFGGDVSGTYNAIVVADDSHNHIISNVDGLQTALDGKVDLAGDTMTGTLNGTNFLASGTIGNLTSGSQGQQMEKGDTSVTTLRFDADRWRLYAGNNAGEIISAYENGNIDFTTGNLLKNGTAWMDNSRNMSNIGTISSGAITSTGTSTFAGIRVNNSNTALSQGGGNSLRIQTSSGYVEVGPRNTGYAHFNTDRAAYYFEDPVHFDGQIYNYVSGGTSDPYWRAGNDGSGSGLDADTVDGVQGSSFLRSDANDSWSGTLTATIAAGSNALDLATNDAYASMRVIRNTKSSGSGSDGMYIGYGNANGGLTRIYGGGATSGGLFINGSGANDLKYNNASVLWHAGNDGSGSGLDADTLDGYQASQFMHDEFMDDAYVDFTVGGNADTYYPVSIQGGGTHAFQTYSITRQYNWAAPNTWNTSSHRGGLTLTWQYSGDSFWGGNDHDIRIIKFDETYSTMVMGMAGSVGGGGTHAGVVVWLRGGNADYRFYGPRGKLGDVNVHLTSVTASNGTVFSSRTFNASTRDGEINPKYPIRDSSLLYDSNSRVWSAGNDGSGSGLDADLLDGVHGSSFLRSDASDLFTGDYLEFQDSKVLRFGTGADFRIWHDGTNTLFRNYLHGSNTYFQGEDTAGTNHAMIYLRQDNAAPYVQLFGDGVEALRVRSGGATVYGDLNSPVINIDRANNNASGINWYSSSYKAWTTYMTNPGASKGPWGNITAPSGTLVTSWALRNFIENNGGYGWTFESGTSTGNPTVVAEIRSSDGSAKFGGSVSLASGNNKGYYFWDTAQNYGIWMSSSGDGRVDRETTSDYNMYFKMQGGTNRGFVFRDNTNNYFSINPNGIYSEVPFILDNSDTAHIQMKNATYATSLYIGGWTTANSNNISRIRNSSGNLHIDSAANGNLYLNHYSSGAVYARQQLVWHAGNDGSGSGLDADLLDGQQGSYYQPASTAITTSSSQSNALFIRNTSPTIYLRDTDHLPSMIHQNSNLFYILRGATNDATGWTAHASGAANNAAGRWPMEINITDAGNYVRFASSSLQAGGYTVWHAGNDGSGSGLDADLLDGLNSGSFLRADADNNITSYQFKTRFQSNTSGSSTAGDQSGLEVFAPSANTDAFMTFHVSGDYAGYFGLDGTTNDLFWGGWSRGAAKYRIWHAANDGSGSGLDADTVDGYHHSTFWKDNEDRRISVLRFTGEGGNSGHGTISYGLFQEGGSWSNPYPDLHVGFHTGIKIGGYYGYNGTRFYNDAPSRSGASEVMSVADGNNNVDVINALTSYSYQGNSNVAGTGSASYHPSGIYSTGNNWLYGTMYMNGNSQYMSGGSMYSTNEIVCNQNYGRGLNGVYSSTRYQHVWMMGTAYQLAANGTSVGNAYGISWTHTNVGTGTNQAISGLSHQMQIRANGTLWCALGNGIWTVGNVTAYSDISVKTNLEIIPDALAKVCQLNGYTYDRTDYEEDPLTGEMPETRQAGVVAQEVEKVLPEVVSGEEGNKAVAYGNMVALLIEAIKELKAEVNDLKAQLERS